MTFTVDAEGNVTGDNTIHDDYTRFSIQKQDESGYPLAGVEFVMENADKTFSLTAVSDEQGLVTFEKIPYGSYAIAPTTDYISLEPGTPFKADSNMQTLDLLYSAHTNKQFITVQTRNGETYFLIIDYDKPIDEEANLYETYFLNLVDDRDLLSILGEDAMPTPEPTVVVVTPEPTAIPTPEPVVEPEKSSNSGMMLIIIALLAGGGALWYFKFRKGDGSKKQSSFDEYDFGDDDEDEADEDEIEEK